MVFIKFFTRLKKKKDVTEATPFPATQKNCGSIINVGVNKKELEKTKNSRAYLKNPVK